MVGVNMPDHEAAVLGAVLDRPEGWIEVAEILHAEDFVSSAGAALFRAMTVVDADGMLPDVLAVSSELGRMNGHAPITALELRDLASQCPIPAAVVGYAREVLRTAERRRAMDALSDGRAEILAARDPAAASAAVADRLLRVVDSDTKVAEPLGASLDAALASLERRATTATPEEIVPTGFVALDHLLTGGLHRGSLYIVASRPGVGKTSLAAAIARNVAGREHPTALFSLEMSTFEIAMRMLCGEADVSFAAVANERATVEDWNRLVQAVDTLTPIPLHIDDRASVKVPGMRAVARRIEGIALIVVDYLQLMTTEDRRQNRQEEVAELSRSLKLLAKELHVPVIACAQLNRDSDRRTDKRPQLPDLRESGAIEQDADVVAFLHPSESERSVTEVIVAKNRNGPTDRIKLAFDRRVTRFSNMPGAPDPRFV